MAEPVNDHGSPVHEWSVTRAEDETSLAINDPEWRMRPLMRAIGEGLSYQFFWKAETDTIQTYEHRLSYRYVHLDKVTGQFYNQQREPITVDVALIHALAYNRLAKTEMTLAPLILEPNLLPFTRAFARSEGRRGADDLTNESASPGRPRSFWSAVHSLFSSGAKTPDSPGGNDEQKSLSTFEQRELKVSAFTRRTV